MTLLQYVMLALSTWTHQPEATLLPWAQAMVAVCSDRAECINLAAQATVESKFIDHAISQRCNDQAWRRAQKNWWRKSCDNGLAFGAWQIHEGKWLRGVILRGSSPDVQARTALWIMKIDQRQWTTWRSARGLAKKWLREHPDS
jgi:hypothetical protein